MSERTQVSPKELKANPLFAPGVKVGNLLFVSGQVALDNDGKIIGIGDAEAQSRHILSRIRAVVQAAGGRMQDVVKITTFLIDPKYYAAFNMVRSEAFTSAPPASSTVIVAGLLRPELLLEVEAVAHIP